MITLSTPLLGAFERRLLVNYRADPDVVARLLPEPFEPHLSNGRAAVGICFLRMRELRPKGVPRRLGIATEGAAHRVAVEWSDGRKRRHGVLIFRRDTTSRLTALTGGRVFPGYHHLARFEVEDRADRLRLRIDADDGLEVDVRAHIGAELNSVLFDDLDAASAFFHESSTGYSLTPDPSRCDGLELETEGWHVAPASITSARSTFFDDPSRFPAGSIEPDCALLMRNVGVTLRPIDPFECGARARTAALAIV